MSTYFHVRNFNLLNLSATIMDSSRPEFFRDRRFIKKGNKTTSLTNNNAVNSYELQMNGIEYKKHNKTNASEITGLIKTS